MIAHSTHKFSPITWEAMFATYFLVLGLLALLNWLFPVQSAALVSLVLPPALSHLSILALPPALSDLLQPYVRYRMVLYLGATFLMPVMVTICSLRGICQTDPAGLERARWIQILPLLVGSLVAWTSYPSLFMQTKSWMGNDIFYFAVTMVFPIAVQLIVQIAGYKLRLLIGYLKMRLQSVI
ncbi:hypothetical protein [Massilia antarctica]|uniref:hypothetical protein n=1 Tax=Massilia antarctica TaxID=2765360 RepID=UPI0006BB94E1|nr:hypothetical protein [Massilia sp. H27-R4]MCY0915391.1 hypothetical protein [Massilia sp. H27-R4]